jgi:PLP dependent protein
MTDRDLRSVLADRVAAVRARMAAACSRVGRDPGEVTLIAVTKTISPKVAAVLPDLGVFDLGENRPQELWRKAEALKELPIHWHMIGHLQRNKVERTLPLVHLIHSVDSLRLLQAIADVARQRGPCPPILLQVNVSREGQKYGFDIEELVRDVPRIDALTSELDLAGLMGMAAYSDDPEQARPAFRELREFRNRLRAAGSDKRRLPHLSMGMSGDFEVAIEEGATLVRVGSILFEGLEGC